MSHYKSPVLSGREVKIISQALTFFSRQIKNQDIIWVLEDDDTEVSYEEINTILGKLTRS